MADKHHAHIIPPEASDDLFKVRPGPVKPAKMPKPYEPRVYPGGNRATTTKPTSYGFPRINKEQ